MSRLTVPIIFERIHPDAVIPEYKTIGAACVDLVITEIIKEGQGRVTVKYGFKAEIPEGYKVEIQPRSSFTHKDWVMQNSPGQIDTDYRGEWMNRFQAIPYDVESTTWLGEVTGYELKFPEFPWKVGERVTQCHVEEIIKMKFVEGKVSSTVRGEGGFGSTGK